MKLVGYFGVLLGDTVNLSQFNLDLLDGRVRSIYAELAEDAVLGPYVHGKIPQGSWAHKTIIKPRPKKEFDADFLLWLDENPEWSADPASYVEQVYSALGRSGTYKDMPRARKCRCVRVTYANFCHVDIVPYLILPDGREVIVNRDKSKWENTNPEGFTQWMRTKDKIAGGNLRKVIRLMKFLRDHKGTFLGTRSIILTTLTGMTVKEEKIVANPDYYVDVPTTLLHITEDLNFWLQENPTKPSIADPSMCGTTFDHRWDDTTYNNFRDKMKKYAADIHEAYHETVKERSIELWQGMFGTGFHAPPPKPNAEPFGATTSVTAIRSGRAG